MLLMAIFQCKMTQTLNDGKPFGIRVDQIEFFLGAILNKHDEIDEAERIQDPAFQQIGILGDLRVARPVEPILLDPADHQLDEFLLGSCLHATPSSR